MEAGARSGGSRWGPGDSMFSQVPASGPTLSRQARGGAKGFVLTPKTRPSPQSSPAQQDLIPVSWEFAELGTPAAMQEVTEWVKVRCQLSRKGQEGPVKVGWG